MKKKLLLLCGVGAALGVTLSLLITILISLTVGDGRFYAVVPELVADCGGELNAVILQTALSMLYGAAWAGAALIWKQEQWSLARQTVTHLLVCSLAPSPWPGCAAGCAMTQRARPCISAFSSPFTR